MQKLRSVAFENDEIISTRETQMIFGGTSDGLGRCMINLASQGVCIRDRWRDNNHNGRLDKGDTIYVGMATAPEDEDDQESIFYAQDREELSMNGVEVIDVP